MKSTLARIHDLAALVADRAEKVERERGIPTDLLEQLVSAGCYRWLVPTSHGGSDTGLLDVLRSIDVLAQGDGAVGWTVGQAALAKVIFGYFPLAALDQLYIDGPDVVGAGAFAPKGRAERKNGGWLVSGQWPFVTGCKQASWLYLNCVVIQDRKIQFGPNGIPLIRMVLLPADEVEILETWEAVGLRGTASHDVVVRRVFCPDEHSCDLDRPSAEGAMFRIPLMDHAGLFVAAAAVGIAQGALDEAKDLAERGKKPAFSRQPLAESAVFHDRIGEAHVTLRAARAFLYSQAETVWTAATSGQPLSMVERATLRASSLHVTEMATRVVDSAYTVGRGSSVYDRSPLQRRLRDIHTATQHAWNDRDHVGVLGALLAGQDVDLTLF